MQHIRYAVAVTYRPSLALLAIALVACSDDAANPSPASTDADTAVASAQAVDQTLRARLGMVFTDTDPWMAGAVLERGTLHVGDRVFLLAADTTPIPVTITAIRDDATQTDFSEATAPQGVFLSFKPEASTAIGDVGSDAMLTGDPTSTPPDSR